MIKTLVNIADEDKGLRRYQTASKKEIYNAWLSTQSVLFQMPTGTGKTRLFASIIKDIRTISVQQAIVPQPRILVLAHRSELIEQISNTITNKYNVTCGIIKSGIFENVDAIVQVASVQSLSRRLGRWKNTNFGFIVIDEAHHALAKTYLKICALFPNAKILGVTATPCRLNGESFRKIFAQLIVSPSVQQFIDMGYLSKFQYYSIKPYANLQSELDNIKFFGANGDYAEKELMGICDRTQVRAQLIKSYKQYAMGKKGIVYTINKTHNKHVAKQYEAIGISVATIDSDTPAEERRQIVYDFRNGKYDIICNVNIFSEGFDCPDIEFIQLARPTLSLSLYLQQVGRALRISTNKSYALILDNVGLYNKFGLPNKTIDWHRLFNGIKYNVSLLSNRKSTHSTGIPQTISESDEDMVLISESGNFNQDVELNNVEYTVYDILATKEQFPIGVRDYLYRKALSELQAKRDQKEIDHLTDLFNITCPYSSFESYIVDTMSCYDGIDDDEMALHMLEDTYMFNAKGKYGVCRLKQGRDMSGLINNASNSVNRIPVSEYFDILLEPIYDKIDIPNSRDCFIAIKEGMYGVINGANLTELIPFKYDDLYEVGVITTYIAKKANKVGTFNPAGEVEIPFKYDGIYVSLINGALICDDNGKYALVSQGELVYRLDKKVEQLTDSLCVFSHGENQRIVYLTNNDGAIVFPSGASYIFLTNNNNEICLEFQGRYILLDTDLTLKSALIDGWHPERNAIFKLQREKRQFTKQQHIKAKPVPLVAQEPLVKEIKELINDDQVIKKKKRPRIIRKTNIQDN